MTRIERGLSVPDESEARRRLEATRASEDTRGRIDALLRSAHAESVSYEDAVADAPEGHLQDIAAVREASAATLRAFQFAIVPGLLQTAAYLRAALNRMAFGQNVAAAVAGRMHARTFVRPKQRVQLRHNPAHTCVDARQRTRDNRGAT